jgi:membrane-associated phospholipid phosphatase
MEPQWWVTLLKSLFTWMQASAVWSYRIPILADVFVFTYPIYFLALYIYWMIQTFKRWNVEALKCWIQYKIAALYIFAGVIVSFFVNISLQFFVDKMRPNIFLWLADLKNETILNKFMPSSSFPSDHAAVTMSIAIMSLLRGIQNKDKKFLRFGGILIIFSLVTWFARVSSGVHWPTDIVWGSIVGIIIPLILMRKPIYRFGTWIAERIAKVI